MRYINSAIIVVLLAAMGARSGAVAAESPDERARKVVGQMTLDEKIQELHGIQDAGHFRTVPPIPRLGIPALNITNGPAGAANGGPGHDGRATALPAPIALAATWDVDMARLYGTVAGSESACLANGLLEAPDVNIMRLPQNGRTFESFSEDPYLASQFAVNTIDGIQSQGVIANVKHYAGNNQEERRFSVSDDVDERTLREIYLPAFEASVKQAHVGSLMGAYNKVNGTFCCENDFLLNQILKKDWNFDGFVTSDFGAVHSTAPSAKAGLDLEMPTGKFWDADLKAAVAAGEVPVSLLDDKLVRRFRTMMRLGVWDNPPANRPIPMQKNGASARLIAEEGMVLLKNTGNLLPLDASRIHSITLFGLYAGKASTGGGGSSHVNPLYTIDPLKGLQDRAGSKINVTLADGKDITAAADLAKSSDIAIVMVGDRETEGQDHSIVLGDSQELLINTVAAANPHTVVVLKDGSAVLMPWIDKVPAILDAWYPGEEDGAAVAAVLFGDFNPSGKLPITFPKTLQDLPTNSPAQYPGINDIAHYSEGVFVGYRHYDAKNIQPLFPFGFGLSYTTFSYQDLKVSARPRRNSSQSEPLCTVDFNVSNSGQRSGAEIVQLYVGLPSGPNSPQPPRQLKRFQRVQLNPGETRRVHFTLDDRAFSYWDTAAHGWIIAGGVYHIMVGSSSRAYSSSEPDQHPSGCLSLLQINAEPLKSGRTEVTTLKNHPPIHPSTHPLLHSFTPSHPHSSTPPLPPLHIVFLGLSITSSWGNGHATTYRGLVRELAHRGHEVLFLERDTTWYAAHRDLPSPPYGRTELYNSLDDLKERFTGAMGDADLVVVGSYVPEGVAVGQWVVDTAKGITAFYDIDTPITLAKLESQDREYLSAELIPRYNLYLSFSGGPILERIERQYGSPMARPLYCSFDPELYFPETLDAQWDLGYLGTYSDDRQGPLDGLMLEAARQWPDGRFVVAGPQYPPGISWPGNVERIQHLPPAEHRSFYNRQAYTLNITRAEMIQAGYSPSVRLFEAAACGTPVISDTWDGLDTFFTPNTEILISHSAQETLDFIHSIPPEERKAIGERARQRALLDHTAAHRAAQLEEYVVAFA